METKKAKSLGFIKRHKFISKKIHDPYTIINFSEINQTAIHFADIIEENYEDLVNVLLTYESYEVVQDEISRTLDLLRNLNENKKYFCLRVGQVTSFLPRNQPLYTFTCFVVIPSLMATEIHFRMPQSTKNFFPKVFKLLQVSRLFPNIVISSKERLGFIKERSALLVNPKTEESIPLTEVVIFTGIHSHADRLRTVFDKRTLFITNGSGHNPIIVSKDADLILAAEAVSTLQFYNQGQDCAAPNSVLVNKDVLLSFLQILREKIRQVKVGRYQDRSCQIGPISDYKDLVRIQNILVENQEWIDPSTPGIIRTREAIIEPTIILKPLALGGNFDEVFAPIIFLQEYKTDSDLSQYFEDPRYPQNAMYISIYGKSAYVKNLTDRLISRKLLHDKKSILFNINPHEAGFERGTKPYGGYGYGASSISINGKITPSPTLPQRDIYEWIVKPTIKSKKPIGKYKKEHLQFSKIVEKDVEKILRLHTLKLNEGNPTAKLDNVAYLDLSLIKEKEKHYLKILDKNILRLLKQKNVEYIAKLKPEDLKLLHNLTKLLNRKSTITVEKFSTLFYEIPKKTKVSREYNIERQRNFFQHIYQLLLGKTSGPRLASFLWFVENKDISRLLDV